MQVHGCSQLNTCSSKSARASCLSGLWTALRSVADRFHRSQSCCGIERRSSVCLCPLWYRTFVQINGPSTGTALLIYLSCIPSIMDTCWLYRGKWWCTRPALLDDCTRNRWPWRYSQSLHIKVGDLLQALWCSSCSSSRIEHQCWCRAASLCSVSLHLSQTLLSWSWQFFRMLQAWHEFE